MHSALGNIPGGGTGTGANVTVVDNGDGTVTMANGIVSITLNKTNMHITSVIYTYDNGAGTKNTQMLQASNQWYYGGFGLGSGSSSYTLAIDPSTNGGNTADLEEISTTATSGVMDYHWSMLRGSPGFYTTATMSHRAQDAAQSVGAWGTITRVPGEFSWCSVDPYRNWYVGVQTTSGVGVPNSPHEISVNLNGDQAGEYADKFVWGMDHSDLQAWGWSAVGATGSNMNIGTWTMTHLEFSDGGPLKRDVFAYPYNNQNNSILTNEVGMAYDGNLAAGEVWSKTMGPYFTYYNNVPTTDGTVQAAADLYSDAVAQSVAESGTAANAWPYPWFTSEPLYVPRSGRGTVTGKMSINDFGAHNPTIAGAWVGLEIQPQTSKNYYDFQEWLKPYQFWTQTDSGGNFTFKNVIAGSNYTLWLYGPGGAGTFMSQNQTGGNPPLITQLPSSPFGVTVTASGTTNLGSFTWTPSRVGYTVFELGVPDRKADEFRHGEDYWSPESSPELGYPTPVWGMQAEYPFDYPSGMTYTVGTSQWARDWNYVMPSLVNTAGAYQPCTATINFNLASAPASSGTASLYLACASDDGGNVILSVNGSNLGDASGVTATPNAISSTGFNPPYQDDSSIHFSDHGPFSDERVSFPASLLKAGSNSLTITMNAKSLTSFLMIDYLRMELTGYVPPAPASPVAYPDNGRNVVRWPVVPGATRYVISRSTTSGTNYSVIVSGALGPVAGSGQQSFSTVDTSATNGTTYYYVVQSYNPLGTSAYSSQCSATPSSSYTTSVPATPGSMTLGTVGSHSVSVNWGSAFGANYYTLYRTTEYLNNAGGYIPLRTIALDNSLTGTSYTDTTVSDGEIYNYYVVASNGFGNSGQSSSVLAMPLPAAPTAAPGGLSATAATSGSSVALSWTTSPGAEGYDIYRSTTSGSFTFPANFVNVTSETQYTDSTTKPGTQYYYRVNGVNVGGISSSTTTSVTTP